MDKRFYYSDTAVKWEMWESYIIYCSTPESNPFLDCSLIGKFTSPSGKTIEAKGFYDGESKWRIRFSPNEAGKHTAALKFTGCCYECIEEACEFTAVDEGSHGRLEISRIDPHFLQTRDGSPFYIFGSGMEAHIPRGNSIGLAYYPEGEDPFEKWKQYLNMLADAGFNRLRLHLGWNSCTGPELFEGKPCGFFKYRDKYEQNPETGKYDMTRFNITYWQMLDRILGYSSSMGIFAEVELFDRCCLENWVGTYRWQFNTYNEQNGGPLPEMKDIERQWSEDFSPVHMQPDRVYNGKRAFFDILEPHGPQEEWVFQMWNLYYQRLYVDYMIARTAAYPNIYFEIMNEIERPLNKWGEYWFRYVRENDPFENLITTSPIYNHKDETVKNLFLSYQTHECNDLISVHNEMHPGDVAEINALYWGLQKPIIYDEVFWIRDGDGAGKPKSTESYEDERKWFWSNFVNGSMTVRVCWQPFEKTPAFDWLRHLKSFVNSFDWWYLVPFTADFTVKPAGIDPSGFKYFQCRIRDSYIIYIVSSDGKKLKDISVGRNDCLPVSTGIKAYNTISGTWTEFAVQPDCSEVSVQLPEYQDDAILVIGS